MSMWKILGGSATGSRHIKEGQGCDDAYGWWIDERLAVAVVADGAGSRTGTSALGAFTAVKAVLNSATTDDFVQAHIHESANQYSAIGWLFSQALTEISAQADRLGIAPDLLATTLSVAVIDSARAVIGQVGDGIAVCGLGDLVQTVAVSAPFEYANETIFLTTPDALSRHLRVFSSDIVMIDAFALTTDGLRYKVLNDLRRTEPFFPFFREAWAYVRRSEATTDEIVTFLANIDDDQTGDDKTLLIGVKNFTGSATETESMSPRPPISVPVTSAIGSTPISQISCPDQGVSDSKRLGLYPSASDQSAPGLENAVAPGLAGQL